MTTLKEGSELTNGWMWGYMVLAYGKSWLFHEGCWYAVENA